MPGIKGQTNNPNGRPRKELSLTTILQEYGETLTITVEGKKLQYRQALILKMWNMALKGDKDIARYIFDRIDGKMTEKSIIAETPLENIENVDKQISKYLNALKAAENEPKPE